MKRRASRLALAAAIGLIALSLLGQAAVGDSGGSHGAPKSLTHHFPLGTQTLSHTTTASTRGSATTPNGASATTPHRGSTATPHRARTTPAARRHDGHGTSSALFLLVVPVVVVGALLIRRSRATGPRHRDRPRARRRPARSTRSTTHARWAYEDVDEFEHKPPPLPLRRRE
jgi:hypothetical protein